MSTLEGGKTHDEPQSRLKDGSIVYPGGVIGASAKDIAEVNSFAKDEQGLGKVGAAVGVVVAAAVGVGGYVATHQETPPPPPISASASPRPTDTITTPAGTFKVDVSPSAKPSESAKPTEAPKTPCIVLPTPEMCATGTHVIIKDAQGNVTGEYVGFNAPSGTKLSTPVSGQERKTKLPAGGPIQGTFIILSDPNNRAVESWTLTGDIPTQDLNTRNISSGQNVEVVGSGDIKNFGFDLLVGVTKFDAVQNKAVPALDTMKKSFPSAFQTPAVEVTIQNNGSVLVSPVYYNSK